VADVITQVGAVGRAYANLVLCQTGRLLAGANLVARGDREIWECYDDGAPVGGAILAIFGWTTDASNYIIIRAAEGHRHDGTTRIGNATGNGAWLTTVGVSAGQPVMQIAQAFTQVDGLRVWRDIGTNRTSFMVSTNAAVTATITRVLVHGTGTFAAFVLGSVSGSTPSTLNVRGSIVVGVAGSAGCAVNAFNTTWTLNLDNCWFHGNGTSINAIQFGGGVGVIHVNNSVSTAVTSKHYNVAVGSMTYTGRANAQDSSDATSALPDDDPTYPSFVDLEIVVTPTAPASPPGIVAPAMNSAIYSSRFLLRLPAFVRQVREQHPQKRKEVRDRHADHAPECFFHIRSPNA